MENEDKWKIESSEIRGISVVTLNSWKYFHEFINDNLINNKNYIFRGQKSDNWRLEPSINRIFKTNDESLYRNKLKTHLENFKFSIRGRNNLFESLLKNEDELWALGQHYFLYTPLLDFTISPYVASYFAFHEKDNSTDYRVVYALSSKFVKFLDGKIIEFRPTSGHNTRLISQNGLFVKFNSNEDLFEMIRGTNFNDYSTRKPIVLYKIRIPNKDRELSLKSLNKMNINHNTLFPDLFGSSLYCNTCFEIKGY